VKIRLDIPQNLALNYFSRVIYILSKFSRDLSNRFAIFVMKFPHFQDLIFCKYSIGVLGTFFWDETVTPFIHQTSILNRLCMSNIFRVCPEMGLDKPSESQAQPDITTPSLSPRLISAPRAPFPASDGNRRKLAKY
jgi:hypothetical protein